MKARAAAPVSSAAPAADSHMQSQVASDSSTPPTDAKPADPRLVLTPPVATDHDKPITGKVAYEFLVDAPAPSAGFVGIQGLAYPFARVDAPVGHGRRGHHSDHRSRALSRG